MNKTLAAFILGIIVTALPCFSDGGNLLVKNGTILTVTKGSLPKGDLLIIGGVIKDIGENLKAPEGVRVIDASGKFVIPGIIDAHTHIALSGTNETGDVITAEVNMRDVIQAEDLAIFTALTGGVTMAHTMHGSANPIGGRDITLKMKWGRPAEELIVPQAYQTLKFALGENPKQASRQVFGGAPQRYPATRMGVNAIIRAEMLAAKNYMLQWERYLKDTKGKNPPKTLAPPRRDLRLEALAELLRGNLVARVHSYRADESLKFIDLSKEFGFKIVCFEHIPEAFKITRELRTEGIGTSVFVDSWAYKVEAAEGIASSAAYCTKNGVLVSINSDGGERMRRLFNDAGKTLKYGGLTEDEALKLISINPAIQLGVAKTAGSLEVGKDGDVAIFNEHPLSAYARCEMTIIEGDVYFDRAQYLKEREEAAKQAEEAKKPGGGQ